MTPAPRVFVRAVATSFSVAEHRKCGMRHQRMCYAAIWDDWAHFAGIRECKGVATESARNTCNRNAVDSSSEPLEAELYDGGVSASQQHLREGDLQEL